MPFWQDVRFAARLLVKDRWFTLAAVTALALGIAANTAVFTLVNAVLLRELPFPDPGQIVAISTRDARNNQRGVSITDFEDLRSGSTLIKATSFESSASSRCSAAISPTKTTGPAPRRS